MKVINNIDDNAEEIIKARKICSAGRVHESHHHSMQVKCHLRLPSEIRPCEIGNGIIDREKA